MGSPTGRRIDERGAVNSRLGWVTLLAAGCSAAPAVQQAERFEQPGVLELLCPDADATLATRLEVAEPLVVGDGALTEPLTLAAIGEGAPRVESYPLHVDQLKVGRATLERREGDTSRPVWVALTASNELLAGGLDETTGLAVIRERCGAGPQAPGSPFLSESGVTARQPLDATTGLGAVVVGACKGARVVTDRMIRRPPEPGWGP
jgi:hypothetical protein